MDLNVLNIFLVMYLNTLFKRVVLLTVFKQINFNKMYLEQVVKSVSEA